MKGRTYTLAVLVVFNLLGLLICGEVSDNLHISHVSSIALLSIRVTIQTDKNQLCVACCGMEENGEEIIYSKTAHLEMETNEGWVPVKLRWPEVILGDVPFYLIRCKTINPESKESFIVRFNRSLFAIKQGQRLRLVIDTWSYETSMKANKPSKPMISLPFDCP
jgi:hypothetical protein